MENEKRFLLATALTIGFLYLWYGYISPPPKVKTQASATQELEQSSNVSSEKKNDSATDSPSQAQTTAKNTESAVAAVSDEKTSTKRSPSSEFQQSPQNKRELKIDGDKAKYILSNQAGSLHEVVLHEFKTKAEGSEDVSLDAGGAPMSYFSVSMPGGESFQDNNQAYEILEDSSSNINFKQALSPDLEIEKKYSFSESSSYLVSEEIQIHNIGEKTLKLQGHLHLRGQESETPPKGSWFAPAPQGKQAVVFINENSQRWPIKDFAETEVESGHVDWAAWDDQYFIYAVIPSKGQTDAVELKQTSEHSGELRLSYPTWDLKAGESRKLLVSWYAGPKDIQLLDSVHPSLDRSINLGSWLGVIARPLLRILKWIHGFVGNYGVAIILLTFLVRLLLFPLTQMQAKSMKKMQLHKPQLDALKAKFGDDREGHSRAMMQYMRENKINPAGGCLPLLPQLPIFFALYRVLYNSIELRHAPFAGWINDLSTHDPYFVLPVLLGIAMFFQQKLTPTPGVDPAQQAVMKFMPIMFTGLMIFLPAGLNLYILVSTLWGIGQQYWIHKSPAMQSLEAA